MSYRWIACVALIAVSGIASAQQPLERASFEGFADATPVDGPVFKIELLIVEGDVSGVEQAKLTTPRDPLPQPTAAPAGPPVPVSAAPTDLDADQAATRATLPHPPHEAPMKVGPVPLLDLVPQGPRVNVLAAPQLAVVVNQEATVQVGSQASFEYLESAGDETFRLRRSEPRELGILLKATVTQPEDDPDAVVISPLQIEVTSLDGREPVKGIGLEVGKPIVSSRSLKTTVRAPLGKECTIPIPSVPNREAALLLRVTRMEFDEPEEKDAKKWGTKASPDR